MTDARWSDVQDEIARAMRHYERATKLYDAGGLGLADDDAVDALDLYRNQMALQHAMQAAHTTLESAISRILAILNEEPPTGANSHADIIVRVSRPLVLPGKDRPAILPPAVASDIDESRRFRHRAMHDYDRFDASLARPAIDAARRLQSSLWPAIAAFRDVIDPA